MNLGIGLGLPFQRGGLGSLPLTPAQYAARWGLQAYWNLASTADAFGTNTLTADGGVTFAPGKVGNAAVFNGTVKMSAPDAFGLRRDDASDFWVAGWYYRTVATAGILSMLAKGNGVGGGNWSAVVSKDYTGNFTSAYFSGSDLMVADASAPINTWNFFMAYQQTGGNMGISYNGAAFQTNTGFGSSVSGADPLYIGSGITGATQFFTGSLNLLAVGKAPPGGVLTVRNEIRDKLYNGGVGVAWPALP